MALLNETEKVDFLIDLLDQHMQKLPDEDILRNYLESIHGFLKTNDSILQKAAISNSVLFMDNLAQSTSETDYLISYFEKYMAELETKLKEEPENDFLKGKIKGIKHAVVIAKMIKKGNEYQGEGISVIID
ncbi:hypothetical protein [Paenibacillus validus]|uniref:Uncharacterized protein n=1 Tax=Paenibacillus validus TaxID=44253 RepID=A0A7X3CUZ8_9BACL|nr:hypothetical protein [Paenibacillus validus]MUG74032.1 hypothetical protein [Paenibacillus validus]